MPARRVNVLKYLRRRSRWRATLIDLVAPLRRARDRKQLYFRTDSHWCFGGLELAYFTICRALSARPVKDFGGREMREHAAFSGDLGAACTPHVAEPATFWYVQRDARKIYASPITRLREKTGKIMSLHTGAHVVYRNDRPNDPRTLILFGDSYSHVEPVMLTIMLAETFREVHFIWSTSIDWSYVDRVKPDILLTEMAERFLARIPNDEFNLGDYMHDRYGAELRAASLIGCPSRRRPV